MENSNNTATIDKRYINIKELSKYTSIPVKTLYEWSSIGKIPSIKVGRRVLFDLQDIDRVMASLKRQQYGKAVNKIAGDIHNDRV